jgi:hypothetical protein
MNIQINGATASKDIWGLKRVVNIWNRVVIERGGRARSTLKGGSFSSAHTWRKCSFVTGIIQHVEYSVPMARMAEIAQNATAQCSREDKRTILQ